MIIIEKSEWNDRIKRLYDEIDQLLFDSVGLHQEIDGKELDKYYDITEPLDDFVNKFKGFNGLKI